VKEYGIFTQRLDLSAGRIESLDDPGNMTSLFVYSLDDPNANLRVKVGGTSTRELYLKQGMRISLKQDDQYFSRVYYSNEPGSGFAEIIYSNGIDIEVPLRVTADMVQQGIQQGLIAVGAAATLVPAVSLSERVNLTIQNNSLVDVWAGNAAVVAGQGILIKASGGIWSGTIAPNVGLYLITAGPAANVNWMEGA